MENLNLKTATVKAKVLSSKSFDKGIVELMVLVKEITYTCADNTAGKVEFENFEHKAIFYVRDAQDCDTFVFRALKLVRDEVITFSIKGESMYKYRFTSLNAEKENYIGINGLASLVKKYGKD